MLQQVGYDSETKTLEFAAALQLEESLTAGDFMVLNIFCKNGTAEGEPVDSLVVTFLTEESAWREWPVLRDIGVVVQFYDDEGKLVSVSSL